MSVLMSVTRVTLILVALAIVALALLLAFPQPGDERWCKKMDRKAQSEWSMEDARDYLEHCAFRDLDLSR